MVLIHVVGRVTIRDEDVVGGVAIILLLCNRCCIMEAVIPVGATSSRKIIDGCGKAAHVVAGIPFAIARGAGVRVVRECLERDLDSVICCRSVVRCKSVHKAGRRGLGYVETGLGGIAQASILQVDKPLTVIDSAAVIIAIADCNKPAAVSTIQLEHIVAAIDAPRMARIPGSHAARVALDMEVHGAGDIHHDNDIGLRLGRRRGGRACHAQVEAIGSIIIVSQRLACCRRSRIRRRTISLCRECSRWCASEECRCHRQA